MFTKLAWLRSPYWCDTVVVVGDSTRPQAIPLAMLTINVKETLGFHNFYAWFLSVSPISIGTGLRSPALRAGEVPLKIGLVCTGAKRPSVPEPNPVSLA